MDELFDLTGKVALVTGGSRGLGLQMVRAFSQRGADVVISSRKLDACEAAAEEMRRLGRRALAISANASRWDDVDRLAAAAYQAFGRIDILVNNAGMSPAIPSHEVTEAMFDKIVSLNFKGPFSGSLLKLQSAWPTATEGRSSMYRRAVRCILCRPSCPIPGLRPL